MAPLSAEELYGPLQTLSPSQLVDEAKVYATLGAPGSPFEVEQRLIHGRLQTVYKQLPHSVRDFWLLVRQSFAKRECVVFKEERYTYEEIWTQSVIVARWLQRRFNVRKGDRVGISSRNYPEFLVAFWAVSLLGAVATVLNSFHDGETLAFSIQDVSCRVVLCDGERFKRIEPLLEQLFSKHDPINGGVKTDELIGVVVMPWMGESRATDDAAKAWLPRRDDKDLHRVFDWQSLCAEEKHLSKPQDKLDAPDIDIQPEDNACILFTSGTTGKPKGVLSTQRQFLSCLRLASFGGARTLLRRGRSPPPPPDPTSLEQASLLLLVPLAHTTGLQSGVFMASAVGARLVMMPTYKRNVAVRIAQQEKVNYLLGIGFMIREIIASGAELPSLQYFSHGGSASAKELPGESRKHYPRTVISAGYGLTEVNGVAGTIMHDDYVARPTSAGRPPIGVEHAIIDPSSGVRLAPGQVGELWIQTPGRAQGYWNRPKETAETFLADGWFRSGDLAKIDEEGFLYIVDRVKDLIIRGGENISCSHVESSVYGHEAIIDCAATAVPDERLGERVGIVCIAKEQVERLPEQEELLVHMAKSLPKYAVPEFVWTRKEPLPRNANGKVLRNEVKKQLLEHIEHLSNSDDREANKKPAAKAKL